ncbi:uncharacterized protein [Choristoneura fumiferana]|uniref:uncharacterized protein n=1 Tax=Choristoneura fumiferana TaxID=7141 RepID=UPI003D15957D
MGGICCAFCSLSSLMSIVFHAFERISMCTMCALLTCCIMFTIIAVLISGIGIGFHYCVVQHSVKAMEKAAKVAAAVGRSGPQEPLIRAVGDMNPNPNLLRSGLAHRIARRQVDQPPPKNLTDSILNKLVYSTPKILNYTS